MVGLYLLSCLQKTVGSLCERVVVAYEKGIFYGAVLARGGIFFILIIY